MVWGFPELLDPSLSHRLSSTAVHASPGGCNGYPATATRLFERTKIGVSSDSKVEHAGIFRAVLRRSLGAMYVRCRRVQTYLVALILGCNVPVLGMILLACVIREPWAKVELMHHGCNATHYVTMQYGVCEAIIRDQDENPNKHCIEWKDRSAWKVAIVFRLPKR